MASRRRRKSSQVNLPKAFQQTARKDRHDNMFGGGARYDFRAEGVVPVGSCLVFLLFSGVPTDIAP